MEQERFTQISKKVKEQTVLKNELSSLKKESRVYEQLGNSGIFFLSDRSQVMSKCQQKLQKLKSEEELKNIAKS